jgi:hypothetical protein
MNLFPNKPGPIGFLLLGMFILGQGAAAQDFGLTLRSLPVFTNGDDPSVNVEYTGTAVPWFAAPLGEQGDLYLSGGFSAEYADKEWRPVPEVYRFEITWRFDSGLRLEAGRLPYREPLSLVMNGLFDGLALSFDLGKTRLSAGAFYTGLLYKKTAYIVVSPGDYAKYNDRDVYFASRRLVFSAGWEIPGLFNTGGVIDLGLIGQFDLNEPEDQIDQTSQLDGNGKIYSQYALAKFTLPFLNSFNAELGTLLGIIEEGDLSPGLCFAFTGGLTWLPPGGVNDRLRVYTAVSSGAWNDTAWAFLPINTMAQGKILRSNISGLALVEGTYTIRLFQSFSADLQAAYFFRTDTRSYSDPELNGDSRSPLLGGEISSVLTWAPVSDISVSLGGGAFFPQWGKSFAAETSARWRVSLETVFSF